MIKKYVLIISILVIAGCSSTNKTITTEPNSSSTTSTEVTTAETSTLNWHHLQINDSPYNGIASDKAYAELLLDKTPSKNVVVAIIDSGTDIEHEDLSANIWINDGEIAGNNIDDDKNGYVDDIHGWNFIGGKNGKNVDKDTYELTRVFVKLRDLFQGKNLDELSPEELDNYQYYLEIKAEFEKEQADAKANFENLRNINNAIQGAKNIFQVSSIDSVSNSELEPKNNDTPYKQQAKQIIKYFKDLGLSENDINDAFKQFDTMYNYGYNANFDPRYIVGDDYEDLTDRYYGNNDVEGPRSDHGTHVAGIVAAVRDNDIGANGVASNTSLMIIRAVPDGDERDKDIANAIRYAVENGADIINMSFGKSYSPQKFYVDEALKFADMKGVLIVNAAGNSAENIDSTISYPNKFYPDGSMMKNFITVGASSWDGDTLIAANFSNYGQTVDLFAPGVEIYSTTPDNTYEALDGTSMASPVVAGVAALVMAYYPNFTASEIKEILLESATPITNIVYEPGSDNVVSFSTLSNTGSIINVYEALKLAEIKSSGTN